MDQDSNQMQQTPTLCRSGCGFYGNSAFDGLCSQCYKDAVKKKQAPPNSGRLSPGSGSSHSAISGSSLSTALPTVISSQISEQSESSEVSNANTLNVEAECTSQDTSDRSDEGKDGKKKRNRCGVCKKKVGLTGFSCRCGGLFCAVHRYSDKHECKFNYRELGAEEIRKNNPVVVGEKVQKI